MDPLLDQFWGTWPWPLLVLLVLLLAAFGGFVWWLRRPLENERVAPSVGFGNARDDRCPECGQLLINKNSFDQSQVVQFLAED